MGVGMDQLTQACWTSLLLPAKVTSRSFNHLPASSPALMEWAVAQKVEASRWGTAYGG